MEGTLDQVKGAEPRPLPPSSFRARSGVRASARRLLPARLLVALVAIPLFPGASEAQNTSLTPSADDPDVAVRSEALYTITFTGAWTTAVTADGVPSGAHFSKLIGGVHNDEVAFLESGGTASPGVESMAEDGGTSSLRSEINAAGANRRSVLEGTSSSVGPTPTVTFSDVSLTADHPRVTLLTMIAPSPDWFVGVSSLSMLDSSGDWMESVSVDLYPWDAGTEDGTEFLLSNDATDPQGVITSLRGVGKFNNEKIATLTFTRQSVLPAAPTISAVHRSDESVTVLWTAPQGLTGIAAYDLRWILSSADETVDANWRVVEEVWTEGPFEAMLTGLSNDSERRSDASRHGYRWHMVGDRHRDAGAAGTHILGRIRTTAGRPLGHAVGLEVGELRLHVHATGRNRAGDLQ